MVELRITLTGCDADEFQCADRQSCILTQFVCDRQNDCNDYSDEVNCSKQTCSLHDCAFVVGCSVHIDGNDRSTVLPVHVSDVVESTKSESESESESSGFESESKSESFASESESESLRKDSSPSPSP